MTVVVVVVGDLWRSSILVDYLRQVLQFSNICLSFVCCLSVSLALRSDVARSQSLAYPFNGNVPLVISFPPPLVCARQAKYDIFFYRYIILYCLFFFKIIIIIVINQNQLFRKNEENNTNKM